MQCSCKPQPPQSIYLRIESAIPGDRANTQCHRHSSLGHFTSRRSHSDLYQRGGVVSPAPPPLTIVQFAIPRTLCCHVQ